VNALSAISKVEGPIAFGVEEQYGITKNPKEGLHGASHQRKNLLLKTRRKMRIFD
jgi:hypothetical protein